MVWHRCCIKGCKRLADLNYLGKGVCDTHWVLICKIEADTGLEVAKGLLG